MNKNTIIGFILMGLVLFGFSWYNQPSEEQINAQRKQDSIENVLKQKAEKEQKAKAAAKKARAQAALTDTTALFHPALNVQNRQLTLKNDKVKDVVLTGSLANMSLAPKIMSVVEEISDVKFFIPENATFATAIGAALPFVTGAKL